MRDSIWYLSRAMFVFNMRACMCVILLILPGQNLKILENGQVSQRTLIWCFGIILNKIYRHTFNIFALRFVFNSGSDLLYRSLY